MWLQELHPSEKVDNDKAMAYRCEMSPSLMVMDKQDLDDV